MKVKITIATKDADKNSSVEIILEEKIVVTESDKRLTAGRARKILKREIKELDTPWHSVADPTLIKVGDRWQAMKHTGEGHIWKYYYIEEIPSCR